MHLSKVLHCYLKYYSNYAILNPILKWIVALNLTLVGNSFAQNINNLDKKYGINKFKLETAFDLYKENCELDLTADDGVKYYKYTRWFDVVIFGEHASSAILGFYKNKLYTVSIDLSLTDTKSVLYLRKNLEELFGLGITAPARENYEMEWFWQTEKTYLDLNKLSCSSLYKPCVTNIFILSNKLSEEIKSDQF